MRQRPAGPGQGRRVLVMTHAVRERHGQAMLRLVVDRLAERGTATSFVVWDRGMVPDGTILDGDGPLREIEAMNRWLLPQWLARTGAVGATRRLRNARLHWWWRRLGRVDAVLVLDPVREEMRHYLPPEHGRVGLLLTGRPLEPAESLETSRDLADVVVAPGPSATGAEVADATYADLVDATPALDGTEAARPPGPPLVVGIGPPDWRAGPELFVRVAAALRDRCGRPVRFGWIGIDPDDGRSFPYRHDAARLGLADDLEWTDEPEAARHLLARADAVVMTSRTSHPLTVHPWTDEIPPDRLLGGLGVPVVAFDTAGADALAPREARRLPFPDVGAAADAVLAGLDPPPANRLDAQLDRLLGTLLGGRP